ncbi:hypothetical protein BDV12DRAFT_205020 [Aspergillus spectabilis]
MDGLSSAASVIAVIQLTGSLVKLCGGYIREVKDAREEILTLQRAITGLEGILQALQKFLQGTGNALPTSSRLVSDIADCLSDLQALEARLDPGKGTRLMRKMGLRALKWPLKRTDMEGVMKNLERYKSSFLLSLQVDQTYLMAGIAHNTDRITQHVEFGKLEGAIDAGFESFSDRDEAHCLQGTRTELLQKIMEWAISPSSKSIFWLKGMAGTGKSTISRTVARLLKDNNHLGASFFFKRGEGDRGNAKKFFPTLIRQLMLRISELRSCVQRVLHDDPDITSKSLKEQFEKLLLQPLLTLDQLGRQPQTAVIVIDALDECEHDQDIRAIIRLLPSLQRAKGVSIRIFVTSRPELPIVLSFSEITGHEYHNLALHEIPEEVTAHDIHLFLQDQFVKIKHDKNISEDWPGDDVIQKLVIMSAPLFISAATVCRYIESSKMEPKSRLTELLADQAKYVSKMDKTYLPILTRLLDNQESGELEQQQLLQEFQDIVGVIVLLAVPLSINTLSLLLGIGADKISNRLDSFRSVLSIPNHRDLPVRILHLSFREFLVQSSTKFRIDERQRHKAIAKSCLKAMQGCLRKDICKLASPGTRRADINNQDIHQYLLPEVQYSCRFWIHHLEQSQPLPSELGDVRLFLQKHFLHWVEAMSLLGFVSEVVGMLDLLYTAILVNNDSILADFLHDAKRFILKNRQIADEAPLQIYCAGLVFAPQTARVRTEFNADFPGWICQLPKVNEKWSAELQALEGHSGSVYSVAFSPNSRLLASGSGDETVRLWDTVTGNLQQILEGHSGSVDSVAFSPDGLLLASGSGDETVRLWDTATGNLQHVLNSHTGSVYSVAFSPNSRLLATGSHDKIVRLWDTATGDLQQSLNGHSGLVYSLAFSPDCRLLASGSGDETVRLWDMVMGNLQQTLNSHSGSVYSLAFSPDGQLLASGSRDGTVQLWDTVTGDLQQTLSSYPSWVQSVAFLPDGRLLASGSHDETVQLWDTATGGLKQIFNGHSGLVDAVAFSPDGLLLASGSRDETVRLWDMTMGGLQQTLDGHSSWVQSVAFSPNGLLLASGSYDNTVRFWDRASGDLQQTLEGHSGSVDLVAFSPNSRLLASGSYDKTVRLWDTATGGLRHILKGHSGWIQSVAFSPDGLLLASGSSDETVRLWDTATGNLQHVLNSYTGLVYSVAFSPDNQLLATGSHDKIVQLWDIATGDLQQSLHGHSGPVYSVAFSPDSWLLASGSDDKTVRLWDTATGGLQQILSTEEMVTELQFSQHGSYIRTNLGSLKISRCGTSISDSSQTPEIFLNGRNWIALNGTQVLWLPPEARPSCSALQSNTLALGHPSGRISLIGFRVF